MTDASTDAAPAEPANGGRRWIWPGGLSARLLLLTVLFALAAGALVLIPSLASYQEARFLDRVRAAELASLAVEAAPARTVSNSMAAQLLNGAGVVSVAVQSGGVRRLLLEAPRMRRTPELVDLRNRNPAVWLAEPFWTLFGGDERRVRVVAKPRFRDGDFVEVVIPNAPLRQELVGYLVRLVWVAIFIAGVAGAGMFIALNIFLVRPIQRITVALERFRADPADPAAHVALSGRRDEIGRAEAELDRMQADLRAASRAADRRRPLAARPGRGRRGRRAVGGGGAAGDQHRPVGTGDGRPRPAAPDPGQSVAQRPRSGRKRGDLPRRGGDGEPGAARRRQRHPPVRQRSGRARAGDPRPVQAVRRFGAGRRRRARPGHLARTGPGPRRRPGADP